LCLSGLVWCGWCLLLLLLLLLFVHCDGNEDAFCFIRAPQLWVWVGSSAGVDFPCVVCEFVFAVLVGALVAHVRVVAAVVGAPVSVAGTRVVGTCGGGCLGCAGLDRLPVIRLSSLVVLWPGMEICSDPRIVVASGIVLGNT
jgi:hypothetical protein